MFALFSIAKIQKFYQKSNYMAALHLEISLSRPPAFFVINATNSTVVIRNYGLRNHVFRKRKSNLFKRYVYTYIHILRELLLIRDVTLSFDTRNTCMGKRTKITFTYTFLTLRSLLYRVQIAVQNEWHDILIVNIFRSMKFMIKLNVIT